MHNVIVKENVRNHRKNNHTNTWFSRLTLATTRKGLGDDLL